MIAYDPKNRIFYLEGKTYSYVMRVNAAGYLTNVHFGGRVGHDGLAWLEGDPGIGFSPLAPSVDGSSPSPDLLCSECGSYGQGDYRSPTVFIAREDGQTASRFRYVSHTVGKARALPGLPHVRDGETLSVTLADACSGVLLTLVYTVWDDSDVLVRHIELRNNGDSAVELRRAYSFCLDLPATDGEFEVLRLHGKHCGERMPERAKLAHGSVRIESSRGASSHQMNPFLALLSPRCTEESGECLGFQLLYSGSFALTAERSQTDLVRVQGGINELNFSWELEPGASFFAPQVAICHTSGGLGQLSREYADFLRAHVIPPSRVYETRPIVVNNWEATYFRFDRDKLLSLIDEAAKIGADTFVLDDGWFGKRDDDTSGLGDWFVNTEKLKGGLDPLITRCKERGIKFGLWFEPEMVSEDSELFRKHPDWAIGKADAPRCACRNQYVLDFSRPEVVDAVYAQMEKLLSAHDISYVKWDMNRHITEFYSNALPAQRQGELSHRYMLGVYSLADRLTKNFPSVFFEGCSGGGGRFDAGMLYYFPQIWTSDNTDAYARVRIQYGTSLCYPLSSMSCHVSASPNHQTCRVTSFGTRGAIASLGATGYELDLSALSEEEKTAARGQIGAYKKIAPLILRGDLYRLRDPFGGNYFLELVVSKDKMQGYAVGMRFLGEGGDYDRRVHLAGLDAEKTYEIAELNITARGDTLMNGGVLLPRLPDFGTFIWHIESK